jgi:hypothetical protein
MRLELGRSRFPDLVRKPGAWGQERQGKLKAREEGTVPGDPRREHVPFLEKCLGPKASLLPVLTAVGSMQLHPDIGNISILGNTWKIG